MVCRWEGRGRGKGGGSEYSLNRGDGERFLSKLSPTVLHLSLFCSGQAEPETADHAEVDSEEVNQEHRKLKTALISDVHGFVCSHLSIFTLDS